jgi:outer membrane cobalamin receptor
LGSTISGIIIDTNNDPIEGVIVKSSLQVRFSNKKGKFVIQHSKKDTLQFLKYGFKLQKVPVSEQSKKLQIKLDKKQIVIEGIDVVSKIKTKAFTTKINQIKPSESNLPLGDLVIEKATVFGDESALVGEENKISLLGHKTKHTLVILDGVPLNRNGESFDLNSIPTSIIESIEIVEGNASAYGGSGAIGGAIILNSKQNSGKINNQYVSSYNFGSFETFQQKHEINLNYDSMRSSSIYEFQYARNNFPFQFIFQNEPKTEKRENNSKKIETFYEQLNFQTPIGKFNNSFQYRKSYKELPGPTTHMTKYKTAYLDANYMQANLIYQNKFELIFPTSVQLSYFLSDDNSFYNNTKSSIPSAKSASTSTYMKNYYSFITEQFYEFGSIKLSADFKMEDFEFNEFDADLNLLPNTVLSAEQKNKSYALLFRNNTAKWFALLPKVAFRYDELASDIDDFETKYNYSWRLEESIPLWRKNIVFSGYYATAFQIPSFYELYWKGDSQASGNPDLLPENSRNFGSNLTVNYSFVELKLGYNHDKIENMIYWVRSVSSNWKPLNMKEAEIENYLVSFKIKNYYWFSTSFDWLRTFAINKTDIQSQHNKNLTYTPSSITKIKLFTKLENFTNELEWKRIGPQNTLVDSNDKQLEAQEYLNTKFSFEYLLDNCTFQVTINCDNILDQRYEIYSASPNPGINWSSGLHIKYEF